jgi:hypothetical protein
MNAFYLKLFIEVYLFLAIFPVIIWSFTSVTNFKFSKEFRKAARDPKSQVYMVAISLLMMIPVANIILVILFLTEMLGSLRRFVAPYNSRLMSKLNKWNSDILDDTINIISDSQKIHVVNTFEEVKNLLKTLEIGAVVYVEDIDEFWKHVAREKLVKISNAELQVGGDAYKKNQQINS